jgi:serine/threonine protein phosphatase 1
MGNHEAALLESLQGDEAAQRLWLNYGGLETLISFGIAPPRDGEDSFSFAERLRKHIPEYLIEWLEQLPLHHRSGSYFFCHAGIRPGTPLDRQKSEDLLWIRGEFLESEADHGAVIVHGHSICGTAVEFADNRINLDTGAYATGVLSALGLEDDDRWVISTPPTR